MQEKENARSNTAAAHAAGKQADGVQVGEAIDTHRETLKTLFPIPPRRAARSKQGAAAGTALAALLVAGLWWIDPAYRTEHFSTQVGERSVIELADGSSLVLDTATELSVQWHLRSRRITLVEGRTHFDVSPSTLRPFTVDAGSAQVRVVGTRFDVWRQADGTRVSVYEGKVAVWREGAEDRRVLLLPGQQTDVHISNGTEADALDVGNISGDSQGVWKDGRLVFLNTPLSEAIAVIQRYRRDPVRIIDPQIGRLTVSGVFDSSNAEQLLDLLPGILPIQVERRSDGSAELTAR